MSFISQWKNSNFGWCVKPSGSGDENGVVSKSYKRAGENIKKYRQNITIFWITESKILAYWYVFSMRDEEATARASFIIQTMKNRPKLSKISTQGDENFRKNQEELQWFVQEQKSENTVKNVKWYEVFLPFSWGDKQDNDLLRAQADVENFFRYFLIFNFYYSAKKAVY